jgi:XamI restriction endonuclease
MPNPTKWLLAQLGADAEVAKRAFRQERLDEPLEAYEHQFEALRPELEKLVADLAEIAAGSKDATDWTKKREGLIALRYLAAPPISEDDLRTLTETNFSGAIRNPEDAATIINTLLHVIDPFRFPWIKEKRRPTKSELNGAVLATASMLAAQKVQTGRRSDATKLQELSVSEALVSAGYIEVSRRPVRLLHEAPEPLTFCRESMLGSTRADFIISLPDQRLLAIECKSSNSAVNSFKRVNHEALGKATKWRQDFGTVQVVAAAVLSGIFNPANLEAAQTSGLHIFWQFRLDDLTHYLRHP